MAGVCGWGLPGGAPEPLVGPLHCQLSEKCVRAQGKGQRGFGRMGLRVSPAGHSKVEQMGPGWVGAGVGERDTCPAVLCKEG